MNTSFITFCEKHNMATEVAAGVLAEEWRVMLSETTAGMWKDYVMNGWWGARQGFPMK